MKSVAVTINLEIEVPDEDYESLLDESEETEQDPSGRDQVIWSYILANRNMEEVSPNVTFHGMEVSEAL